MPSFLAKIHIHKVYDQLRLALYTSQRRDLRFSVIASILDKQVQRSRYDEFLISLADALQGYDLWCPAFVDFRGRIYRTGFLHFHERDIAKSRLLFSTNNIYKAQDSSRIPELITKGIESIMACATYSH